MYQLYNVIKLIFIIINLNSTLCFNFGTSRRSLITNTLLLANTNFNNRHSKILLNETSNKINNNIYFNGAITDESCMQLTQALDHHRQLSLKHEEYPDCINLFIQSPGGSLLPTLALVDEIKNYDIDIHTYVRGYAASAATLLSVVGKKRYIYKNSLMMIHGVKLNEQSVSTVLDVKDLNYNVDLFMSIITDIYIDNCNIDKKTLLKLLDHDIWLNSKNALELGLVDKIL
jgi:ATP-dependent Clp protease protease subunit